MPTQREIASHLCLSVGRIQQLQYACIKAKDANLDSDRRAYLHWLRSRIKEKPTVNAERARRLCLSTEAWTWITSYHQREQVFNQLVHDVLDKLANTSV